MGKSAKCKVDALGRITIPHHIRLATGICPHDRVDVVIRDNGLFIYKLTEEEILKNKLDDVMLAVSECKEIDPGEVATVVSILSKLVKEDAV